MPFVYIGRKNGYVGKSLWEILGNLKDFGKGRVVVRSKLERLYSEPTYYRIVHAQPLMDEKNFYGRVLVEEVFRGKKNPELRDLTAITYKNDYKLVPKHEEYKLVEYVPEVQSKHERVLPSHVDPPPLLKMIAAQRRVARFESAADLKMEVAINKPDFNHVARIAEEGETPTIPFDLKPSEATLSRRLYQGIVARTV